MFEPPRHQAGSVRDAGAQAAGGRDSHVVPFRRSGGPRTLTARDPHLIDGLELPPQGIENRGHVGLRVPRHRLGEEPKDVCGLALVERLQHLEEVNQLDVGHPNDHHLVAVLVNELGQGVLDLLQLRLHQMAIGLIRRGGRNPCSRWCSWDRSDSTAP